MFASPSRRLNLSVRLIAILITTVVCGVLGSGVAYGQAQANAADLQGFVRDASNAVVVGATVKARNTSTNFTREVTTNDEGYYQITSLPPGTYEVTVEAPGFSRGRIADVVLTVGQRADQIPAGRDVAGLIPFIADQQHRLRAGPHRGVAGHQGRQDGLEHGDDRDPRGRHVVQRAHEEDERHHRPVLIGEQLHFDVTRTLETAFDGVYAVGDVTSVGTPKAGVFAEGQAAVVASGRGPATKCRAISSTPATARLAAASAGALSARDCSARSARSRRTGRGWS